MLISIHERVSRWMGDWSNWAVLFAVLIIAGEYFPLLVTGEKMLTHDSIAWFGIHKYTIDSLAGGSLPLWNPYGQAGSSMYPVLNLLGMLEPISLLFVFASTFLGMPILKSYVWMSVCRIVFLSVGCYWAYKEISGSREAAKISAVVVFMALMASSLHQNGFTNSTLYLPWLLFLILRYLKRLGTPEGSGYARWFALLMGVQMGIYIPSYSILYLMLFALFGVLTGAIPLRLIWKKLRINRRARRRFGLDLLIVAAVTLGCAAFPILNVLLDMSSEGELFSHLRTFTSTWRLPPIIFDGAGQSALAESIHSNRYVFGTFLNAFQHFFPNLWKIRLEIGSVIYLQETYLFAGLASIWVIWVTLRVRSRYRYTALLTGLVIFFLMTAVKANAGMEPWHEVARVVFPPLRLVKVYENFLGAHLFNLGMLLSIGLPALYSMGRPLIRSGWRLRFFSFPILVALLWIFSRIILGRTVPGDYGHFGHNFSDLEDILSSLNGIYYQAALYAGVLLSILYGLHWWGKYRGINPRFFGILVSLVILGELLIYNRPGGIQSQILNDGMVNDQMLEEKSSNRFNTWRSIHVPPYFRMRTYSEAIHKQDSLLPDIFRYNGSTVFYSKIYYEMITHVAFYNLAIIAGINAPKVQFFEKAAILEPGKVLPTLSIVKPSTLREVLLIEKSDKTPAPDSFIPQEITPGPVQPAIPIDYPPDNKEAIFSHTVNFRRYHFERVSDEDRNNLNLDDRDWHKLNLRKFAAYQCIPKFLHSLDETNVGFMMMTRDGSRPPKFVDGYSADSGPDYQESTDPRRRSKQNQIGTAWPCYGLSHSDKGNDYDVTTTPAVLITSDLPHIRDNLNYWLNNSDVAASSYWGLRQHLTPDIIQSVQRAIAPVVLSNMSASNAARELTSDQYELLKQMELLDGKNLPKGWGDKPWDIYIILKFLFFNPELALKLIGKEFPPNNLRIGAIGHYKTHGRNEGRRWIRVIDGEIKGKVGNSVIWKRPQGEFVFFDSGKMFGDLTFDEGKNPFPNFIQFTDGFLYSPTTFDGSMHFFTELEPRPGIPQGISLENFSANRASFKVSNKKPGFFYYADGWSKYWKAYDNGKPTPVHRANHNFKAVYLKPGEHVVTFQFRPTHALVGLALSIGVPLIVVLWIGLSGAIPYLRRKRLQN